MADVFFVIGCARSGTTALARILGLASNAQVHVEQEPKLRIESRKLMEGELSDPGRILVAARRAAIEQALAMGKKYGDKNPCYLPFIPYLTREWDCKIVWVTRDGRDTVRSLMDWHELHARNFFVSEEDGGSLAAGQDPWDYSRLRPSQGDPFKARWKELDRFEKCAWHWAAFNRAALSYLEALPPESWMRIDMTSGAAAGVASLYAFLGLEGYDEARVAAMLGGRINSNLDRSGRADMFPAWQDWDAELQRKFRDCELGMMSRLGYWELDDGKAP